MSISMIMLMCGVSVGREQIRTSASRHAADAPSGYELVQSAPYGPTRAVGTLCVRRAGGESPSGGAS